MRILGVVALFVLAQGLSGCDGRGAGRVPFGPSPVPPSVSQPAPGPAPAPSPTIRVFIDPTTGLETSEVHDAQRQIVRFNTVGEIIWMADGTHFPGYWVDGRVTHDIGAEVQFATIDGDRRAYLIFSLAYHHYDPPPNVVDLEVVDGKLVIVGSVPLPGT